MRSTTLGYQKANYKNPENIKILHQLFSMDLLESKCRLPMSEFSGYHLQMNIVKQKIKLVKLVNFSLLNATTKLKLNFLLLKGIAQ